MSFENKIKRAVVFPDWMILKELMLQGKGCVVMPTEFGPFSEDVVQLSSPQQDTNQSSFFALYRHEFSRGALATTLLADLKLSLHTP